MFKKVLVGLAVIALLTVVVSGEAQARNRGWHNNNVRVQRVVTVQKVVQPQAVVVQKVVEVPGLKVVQNHYDNVIVQEVVVEKIVVDKYGRQFLVQNVVDNHGRQRVQKVVQVNRRNVQVNVVRNRGFFRR